ncbi:MAG: HAD-IA family hydrolase, partial [Pseudorhodoplanes sp.]|nr:HAD-IA family hydrolase [Pseudorhodoplanes sp.]
AGGADRHGTAVPGRARGRQGAGGAIGYPLGIATGKSQRGVRMVLGHHGLIDYFHTIKTADDAPSKPHPGMVMECMREAGVLPGDTVVIGDTTYDIAMAHAAGARAIGVAWGYHPVADLQATGADEVIGDGALIPSAIERLFTSVVVPAAE